MGFANVRAGTRVLMLVLVQAYRSRSSPRTSPSRACSWRQAIPATRRLPSLLHAHARGGKQTYRADPFRPPFSPGVVPGLPHMCYPARVEGFIPGSPHAAAHPGRRGARSSSCGTATSRRRASSARRSSRACSRPCRRPSCRRALTLAHATPPPPGRAALVRVRVLALHACGRGVVLVVALGDIYTRRATRAVASVLGRSAMPRADVGALVRAHPLGSLRDCASSLYRPTAGTSC